MAGRLLETVAGKAVDEDEVGDFVMRTDDGVLVQGVEGVVADPCIDDLDGFEGRHTVGDNGPDDLFPMRMVDGEIIVVSGGVFQGRTTAKVIFTV